MDKRERQLRRLLILCDYGFDCSGMARHIDHENFLEDEWLDEWWGIVIPGYVQDELDALSLIAGARDGKRAGHNLQ